MEKKNILIVVNNLNNGGVQSFVLNLYKSLDKNRFKVDFIVEGRNVGSNEKLLLRDGCHIYHLPELTCKPFKYMKMFKKIMKQFNYHVVHCHLNFLSMFPLSCIKKNVIRICHAHASYPPSGFFSKIIRYIFKIRIRHISNYRLGCSELSCRWLYGNNNFFVIDNGINVEKNMFSMLDREHIRKMYGIQENENVIVNVGNLVPVKRQRFLIDAFANALKNNHNLKLLILGDGEERSSLLEQIQENGIEDNVMVMGSVSNVEQFLSASDAFVLSSIHEGFSIALIEACANGLPCIISDRIAFDASLEKNIYRIDMLKINELSASLSKVNDMKRNNIDMNKFDVNFVAKRVEQFYLGVIK